jgi:alpha-1,3-rhamnosyl/mannosyltransferase
VKSLPKHSAPENRRLRVALDLRLAAYQPAGIARYAIELAQALDSTNELELVELHSRKDPVHGPRSRRLFTPPHHAFERYTLGIEALLRAGSPLDVFHATDFIVPRIPGVATVATVHDLTFLRHPEFLPPESLDYYRQIRRSQRWTDSWITPSAWTARDLEAWLGIASERVFVIPHGVPSHLTSVEIVPLEERGNFLLTVGTIEPRKRFDLLLDALDRMPETPPVYLAGRPGWCSEGLQRRIAADSRITWIRQGSDEQLTDLFRRARALVVPSIEEGFGLQALEAMACGTPVVSSGGGALSEVTGRAALEPGDPSPEAWAAALERVCADDTLWSELSEAAVRRARHFSWSNAAAETIKVYQETS